MLSLLIAHLCLIVSSARVPSVTILDLQFDNLRAAVNSVSTANSREHSANVEVIRSLLNWIAHTEYGSNQGEAQARLSSIVLHATLNSEFDVLMAFAAAASIGPCDPHKIDTKLGRDMLLRALEDTASRLGMRTQQGYPQPAPSS